VLNAAARGLTRERAALLPALAPALAVAVAVAVGVLAAAAPSPFVVGAGLVGCAILALVLWRPTAGILLFIVIVATLPFAVIPVSIGAQLTLVDAALIATFASSLPRLLLLRRHTGRLVVGAPGTLLLTFVAVAITAFLLGTGAAAVTPDLVRRFAKLLASLALFLVAANLLADRRTLFRVAAALMAAGALAGAVATALWLLPSGDQLRLLTSLRVVGYPTSDVLRYVPGANNTYTTQLRAIGTAIDPNVLGGTLMLALLLTLVQCAAPRPVLPRAVLVLFAVATLLGVATSLSRASWLGLAVGSLLIGTYRYRRIWLLVGLAALALLVAPPGRDLVARFVSGFSTADRATAFRFGEYANALTIIQRYPLFGIGFGASPDIDVTAGVSSAYLLVAEQTGLVGLAAYGATLLATWLVGLRGLQAATDPRLAGVQAGLLAAVSGALVAGLLDHYFANGAFPHAIALFWLYAAALVAGARLSRSSDQPPTRAPYRSAPGPPSSRAELAAPGGRSAARTLQRPGAEPSA